MENSTIKLDGVMLINKRRELNERNAKAESYSAMVERRLRNRKERISKIRCFLLYVLLIGGTFATLATAYARDYTRTETAVFVGIDEETGAYIYQTEDGHEWLIYDHPEVYAEITFHNNGTDSVKDDFIIGFEELK